MFNSVLIFSPHQVHQTMENLQAMLGEEGESGGGASDGFISPDEALKNLMKKAADLTRLNRRLDQENKMLHQDTEAVLSSSSSSRSSHHPHPPTSSSISSSPMAGAASATTSRPAAAKSENRSPNPRPLSSSSSIKKSSSSTFSSKRPSSARGPSSSSAAAGGGGDCPSSSTGGQHRRSRTSVGDDHEDLRGGIVHEDDDGLTEGMSHEAMIRIQKARIAALQNQLKEVTEIRTDGDKRVANLESEVRMLTNEKRTLSARLKSMETALEKEHRQKAEGEANSMAKGKKVEALDRDLQAARKLVKKLEADCKNKEVRLNRALEEAERYKIALNAERNKRGGGGEAGAAAGGEGSLERKEMERLEGQVRKLEKQKSELLIAFKKQGKLIDVLKRQKLHIEAARLLSFTEEEFLKVLDWGM